MHEDIGEDHRDWWDERYHQFASYHFIDNEVKRYGKVTSNAAEQLNSVHVDNRGLPILLLIEAINNWNMKMFMERKTSVRNLTDETQSLTSFASEKHIQTLEVASKRSVSWVQ